MPPDIRACLGRRMGLLRPHRNKVDPRYLLYYYLGPDFQREIKARTNSGATVDRIALKELPSFPIRVPELGEQQKIAQILGGVDDKIELNRQINTTLESMAQALFKSWFVDFDPVIDNALAAGNDIPDALQAKAAKRKALGANRKPLPEGLQQQFPDRFVFAEEIGWVPEGWEVCNFGKIIGQTIGGDWGKDGHDEKHVHEVAIVRGTDIPAIRSGSRGGVPTRWVEAKKFITRELIDGDIVLEVSGGSPKQPTGRSVLITSQTIHQLGGLVVPASFCRKLRPISVELGVYASLHLSWIYSLGKMWGYQNQSTGISNFQTKAFLEAEHIVLPSCQAVMDEFYRLVRPLINKSRARESESLAALRDTLLPKLLSGELRIPEAEKQLAEAL